jgi:WD40 repeat protein
MSHVHFLDVFDPAGLPAGLSDREAAEQARQKQLTEPSPRLLALLTRIRQQPPGITVNVVGSGTGPTAPQQSQDTRRVVSLGAADLAIPDGVEWVAGNPPRVRGKDATCALWTLVLPEDEDSDTEALEDVVRRITRWAEALGLRVFDEALEEWPETQPGDDPAQAPLMPHTPLQPGMSYVHFLDVFDPTGLPADLSDREAAEQARKKQLTKPSPRLLALLTRIRQQPPGMTVNVVSGQYQRPVEWVPGDPPRVQGEGANCALWTLVLPVDEDFDALQIAVPLLEALAVARGLRVYDVQSDVVSGYARDTKMRRDISVSFGTLYPTLPFSHAVAAAVSSNGKQLAVACQFGIYVFNCINGALIQVMEDINYERRHIALSPDGSNIISEGRIWSTETGRLLKTPEAHRDFGIGPVAFLPDGKRIVSGGNPKLWDAITGKHDRSFETKLNCVCLALSNDGLHLAIGGGSGRVEIWNFKNGELMLSMQEHPENLVANGLLKLPEALTEKIAFLISPIRSLAFSPDVLLLACALVNQVVIWSLKTVSVCFRLDGHKNTIESLRFSADGTKLVSGSNDGEIRVWCTKKGECITRIQGDGVTSISYVAFSENDLQVLSVASDSICWIDISSGKVVRSVNGLSGTTGKLRRADSRNTIVSGYAATLRLWDVKRRICLHQLQGHTANITDIDSTSEIQLMISGSDDGTVRLWNSKSGSFIRCLGRSIDVSTVAISPDGKRALAGDINGVVKLWDSNTGALLREFRGESICYRVAFSEDMRLVMSGNLSSAWVWKIDTGEIVHCDEHQVRMDEELSAFFPDGSHVLFAYDDVVYLFDIQAGKRVYALNGHTATITCLAYSSKAKRILTGDSSGTIRIWCATTGKTLNILHLKSGIRSVQFLSEEDCIVSGSIDEMIQIWELPKHQCTQMWLESGAEVNKEVSWQGTWRLAKGFNSDSAYVCAAMIPSSLSFQIVGQSKEDTEKVLKDLPPPSRLFLFFTFGDSRQKSVCSWRHILGCYGDAQTKKWADKLPPSWLVAEPPT